MSLYVLQRNPGEYVARPGSAHSYTRKLEEAQTFPDREAALRGKCGNEFVRSLDEIVQAGRYA